MKNKMSEKEMLHFTKGIYYLLKGKINIIDSLELISNNYKNDINKKIKKVKKNIEKGKSLSLSFKEINEDREFLEMIKIGEETGKLESIFENLYKKYEFRIKIKKEIKALSIYPMTVIITAIIIVFILLKMIIPKFVAIYEDIGQELPKMTKIVINMSKIVDKYSAIIVCLSFFLFVFSKIYIKNNKIKYEKTIVKIKLLGTLYKEIKILDFSKNMYSLLNAKIAFRESLKLCSNSSSFLLNEEIKKICKKIEKGESIEKSFKNSEFFNKEYVIFLNIGEKTGDLTESFYNLSEIYYEKVEGKIKIILKLFEPFSIIFIGLIIGTIIMSVMLPIFKMGEML